MLSTCPICLLFNPSSPSIKRSCFKNNHILQCRTCSHIFSPASPSSDIFPTMQSCPSCQAPVPESANRHSATTAVVAEEILGPLLCDDWHAMRAPLAGIIFPNELQRPAALGPFAVGSTAWGVFVGDDYKLRVGEGVIEEIDWENGMVWIREPVVGMGFEVEGPVQRGAAYLAEEGSRDRGLM